MIYLYYQYIAIFSNYSSFYLFQKYPNEGLVSVVKNVFDFDMYNKEMQETIVETMHKHGIPVGANPNNVILGKE